MTAVGLNRSSLGWDLPGVGHGDKPNVLSDAYTNIAYRTLVQAATNDHFGQKELLMESMASLAKQRVYEIASDRLSLQISDLRAEIVFLIDQDESTIKRKDLTDLLNLKRQEMNALSCQARAHENLYSALTQYNRTLYG